MTFPTTSSSAIPLQLLQLWRSPFFGIGTTTALTQSLGTLLSLQAVCIRSNRRPRKSLLQLAALILSGRIPDFPGALLDINLAMALVSSSSVGERGGWGHLYMVSVVVAQPSQSHLNQLSSGQVRSGNLISPGELLARGYFVAPS